MQATTIKDIKAQASAIYARGARGAEAWKRLNIYVSQFDNVDEVWGEVCVYIRGQWRPLYSIIKSDFFYQ